MAPFAVSSLILLLCLIIWLKRPSIWLGLILVGGISNFLEKVITGTIHDMLVVGNLEFNPADILIAAGFILLWISQVKIVVK